MGINHWIKKFLLIVLFALSIPLLAQEKIEYKNYTVKSGDTKYSLAKNNGLSVEELENINPQIKESFQLGIIIRLPENPKVQDGSPKLKSGQEFYAVKAGETVYGISSAFGLSPVQLIDLNPKLLTDVLMVGDSLIVPSEIKTQSAKNDSLLLSKKYYLHKVQPKETLYSLSKKYSIGIDSIAILNPEIQNGLNIGFLLKLPKNRAPAKPVVIEELASDTHPSLNPNDSLSESFKLYQLEASDDYLFLRNKFGITKAELLRINPELNSGLEAGKYILVPRHLKEESIEDTSWLDKLFAKVDEDSLDGPSNSELNIKAELNRFPSDVKVLIDDLRDTSLAFADTNRVLSICIALPFDSEYKGSTARGNSSKTSSLSLDFYHGFLVAIDSLKKQGFSFNIDVYDTKIDGFENRIAETAKKSNYEICIGPLFSENITKLDKALADYSIPIVSPLSKNTSLKTQNYIFHCYSDIAATNLGIANIINTNYSDANLVFVKRHNSDDQVIFEIKSLLNARDSSNAYKFNELVYDLKEDNRGRKTLRMLSKSSLRTYLSTGVQNVFISPYDDAVINSDLMTTMRSLRDTNLRIVAHPKILQTSTIEASYMSDLKLMSPQNYFVDYSDSSVMNFISTYRNTYHAEPSKYAIHSFDLTYYFMKELRILGNLNGPVHMNSASFIGTGFNFRANGSMSKKNYFNFPTVVENYELKRIED